jgi:hypothetical protein
MDWKSLIGYALIGVATVYVFDIFRGLLADIRDIRDSLRNIEEHLTERDDED